MLETAFELLKKIESCDFKAYIVGGYPRDIYLNRKSVDIDICTNATPKDLKDIFKDIMLPNVQYGSSTVIMNNIRFEITTFRRDIKYENNRIPVKIKYIDNLIDDLKRRDFTINTLCIDSNNVTIDLIDAKKDLDNKIIKMVGNPRIRLKEDALRILRAIRFATVLNFKIDNELKKYIKKYGKLLKKLSYNRKKEELDKIFSSANVSYGIELIKELKLDDCLELTNIDKLVITSSIIGIWAQFDISKYPFTNVEKEQIELVKELLNKDVLEINNLYKYGLYISCIVGEIKGINKKTVTEKYNNLPIKSKRDIEIDVTDVCEILNKKPGSYLKKVFSDLEKAIIGNNINNCKDELKKYIISNINQY